MPLLELDAQTAWRNIFHPASRWPSRDAERMVPIAHAETRPSFQLKAGEKIFTMGSCFARNIEDHLAKRGFDVPGHKLTQAVAAKGDKNVHIQNKYNPMSMLQEIKWGFGIDSPPSPEQRLMPIKDDLFIDLHLHMQPENRETCLWLIRGATEMFSTIGQCRVFVITLGLIEAWFDRETGRYINEPQNFFKLYPGNAELQKSWNERFVFRVLSFEEAHSAIKESLALIKERAQPDARVLLTVSPVPLAGSFTGKDVLIANSYSKSVLRSVAETICYELDFVDYFPAFESVTLSKRDAAWEPDGVHVQDRIVAFNIGRMLDKYLGAR